MFKVGDKVKILSKEEIIKKCIKFEATSLYVFNTNPIGFHVDMFKYCEKIFTISEVSNFSWENKERIYKFVESNNWSWVEWMFKEVKFKQLNLFEE